MGWVLFLLGLFLLGFALITETEDPDFLNTEVFALAANTIHIGVTDNPIYFRFVETNLLDEIIELLLIIGGICIAFSKHKDEDEFISKLRLDSLLWATYINYGVLIFSILFIYELSFFYVLVANMFTILLLFIIRFNWVLIRSAKFEEDEK
ncbi:hypothetical protein [Mesonia sp.]|uniref:hypothetical protein n=1 Tax=Mesonia sp. TaxID=1960830 RepID=UPI0025BEE112|nr:hypothetical protein [Mesonia sp.]